MIAIRTYLKKKSMLQSDETLLEVYKSKGNKSSASYRKRIKVVLARKVQYTEKARLRLINYRTRKKQKRTVQRLTRAEQEERRKSMERDQKKA